LRSQAAAFASVLVEHDLDVVAVQEVKQPLSELMACMQRVNRAVAAEAERLRRPRHSGYSFRAAPNAAAPAAAGVMLLWRRDLVGAGLEVEPETAAGYNWGGRVVQACFRWGGHRLRVASVYCPNEAPARVQFLQSTVRQVWQQATPRQATLLLGDWNFTSDPARDRRYRGNVPTGDPHGDRASTAALLAAAPSAVDVFRVRHPTRRSFTFFSGANGHAARHDRAYASAGLAQHVLSCRAEPVGLSDHDPVVLELLPARSQAAAGRGVPRARLDFLADASLERRFSAWLSAQVQAAPSDAAALLAWWPGFKRRVLGCTRALQAAWRSSGPGPSSSVLVQQVRDAVAQLGRANGQQQVEAAMGRVAASRAALRFSQQRVWQSSERLLRQQWLHAGERPQPVITEQLRALDGGRSRAHVVLRAASGGVAWRGSEPAHVAAAHYAAVSAQPRVDAAAQQDVLAAVRAAQPAGAVAAAGGGAVHATEVRAAMLSSRPGTAPGPDGLPLLLYKRYQRVFLPLLSRVFSAVGGLRAVPPGFLAGCISGILKPGADPHAAAGYRPITLLNTDYRLLARVLADRLQPALQSSVSPCQTAFLKGRRSGANILTLQLLCDGLPAGSEMVAALLDFNKAYDTIDRPFLLSVLRELGVGDDFVSWVELLLRGTSACVVMNGFRSAPRMFQAGVRQGCPLSPLLYLCVAEALVRFLQREGVGVDVLGERLCATQFADDTQVFLQSVRQLPGFFVVMDRFGQASGQRLNRSKSKVLLLGRAARAQASLLQAQQPPGGPQVVCSATVLGVPIGVEPAGGQPGSAAVADRLPGVLAALTRLSRVQQLSAFGRGLGSAAYGVSLLLYAAEFDDVPSESQCAQLQAAVAALVDRGDAPGQGGRVFAGVKAGLLPGKPAHGGFGALPWREHLLARHAWWGAQFAAAPVDTQVPWIRLGRAMLRGLCPTVGPMALFDGGEGARMPRNLFNRVPRCLRRLMGGLAALGPVSGTLPDTADATWVPHVPLWGNPLVPCPPSVLPVGAAPAALSALPVQFRGPGPAGGGGTLRGLVRTPDDLVRAARVAVARSSASRGGSGPWFDARSEAYDLFCLLEALPQGWKRIAEQRVQRQHDSGQFVPGPLEELLEGNGLQPAAFDRVLSRVPTERSRAVECMLVQRLGWRRGERSVPVVGLTVRAATALQLGPLRAERRRYVDAFVQEVGGPVGRAGEDARRVWVNNVFVALRELWRLRWDNHFKEVYWRLVLNGLATSARLHVAQPCGVCGLAHGPHGPLHGRLHHFWECPVARAVVAAVQQQLPHAWCVSPLSPHHVLFMHRPPGASPATTVHRGVWRVVCLAAVNAMDVGRRAAAGQQWEARAAAAEAAAAAGQPQPAAAGGAAAHQRRLAAGPPLSRAAAAS
jgi:exonuclease III